jgi:hypothetical protein
MEKVDKGLAHHFDLAAQSLEYLRLLLSQSSQTGGRLA